jgi:hypothetical protein
MVKWCVRVCVSLQVSTNNSCQHLKNIAAEAGLRVRVVEIEVWEEKCGGFCGGEGGREI